MSALLFGALLAAAAVVAAPPMSQTTLTLSGVSSGGAFATQYEFSYSKAVRAVGVIAGVPYYCGLDNVEVALDCMSYPYAINLDALNNHLYTLAIEELVDDVSNIKSHTVLLFSGTKDSVVAHGTMIALAEQYVALGLVANNSGPTGAGGQLTTIFDVPAEHSWITNSYGSPCSTLGVPYINNCDVDFAGEFFRLAWTNMQLAYNGTRGVASPSRLTTFSQTHFGASSSLSMDTIGYVYTPAACSSGRTAGAACHVHVSFHGCEQYRTMVGNVFALNSGLNEWAESNSVIVVYPQTVASSLIPYNPKGCWDWWGYDGAGYETKAGAQMQVIHAMVEYLLAHGSLPSS